MPGEWKTVTDTGRICMTFDSIYSKLRDNSDVYERHAFRKHDVRLSGLTERTPYAYRIAAQISPDSTYYSDYRFFATAGDTTWRAAVISDFHHYSPLWRRLDAAMAMLDTLNRVLGGYDFVLSPGDQCAWGASYNYWTELSEQPAYKNYMWASVQGNHDHMSRDKVLTDAYFRDTHTHPLNGYEGQEGVCYSFRYGDVLFIMLNNEAMRNAESLERARTWIRSAAEASDARYKVVVEHYEWLWGIDGRDSQLRRFADLFTDLGIDLAISGNNHVYLRTHPLVGDKVSDNGVGVTYIVAPSSDDSRGRDMEPLAANAELIATRWSEGPHTVGAMLMDVTPQRIIMTLYDRHGTEVDTVTVPARR